MGETADELTRRTERAVIRARRAGETDATLAGEPSITAADAYADDADDIDGGDLDETVETEEIRVEIEQTRAELGETLDVLQERLRPSTLMEQAKEQITETKDQVVDQAKEAVYDATVGRAERMVNDVSDTAMDAGSSILDTIKANPIPALMVGLGLGWLWMNRGSGSGSRGYSMPAGPSYDGRKGPSYYRAEGSRGAYSSGYAGTAGRSYGTGYDTGYGTGYAPGYGADYGGRPVGGYDTGRGGAGMMDQAQETVGRAADRAQETVGAVADQAQDTMGDLADAAQYRAQRMYGQMDQMLYDNPLAVGAAVVGLGVAVGLALPGTEYENRMVGGLRDDVMEQARTAVEQVGDKAEQTVEHAGEQMKQEGDRSQQTRPQGARA